MNERTFVLKGTICYSNSLTELSITENGYLVCEDGRCAGVFDELPEKFAGISCTDFGDELIIPGLTDLHLHAPQYTFRASGMDLELLDWLNTYTFPQEARYEDTEFAKEAYSIFTEDMKKSPNTRACIFGTLHVPATEILRKTLENTGFSRVLRLFLKFCKNQITVPSVLQLLLQSSLLSFRYHHLSRNVRNL